MRGGEHYVKESTLGRGTVKVYEVWEAGDGWEGTMVAGEMALREDAERIALSLNALPVAIAALDDMTRWMESMEQAGRHHQMYGFSVARAAVADALDRSRPAKGRLVAAGG